MNDITPERLAQLEDLEKRLGVTFSNKELLNRSLTHSSYAHEHPNMPNYERFEFFGDAVLKIVISEYLLSNYPELREGDLTKIRAFIVSDVFLAETSKILDLGEFILVGENERRTGGKKRFSNLANSLEAIFGGVYFDSGIEGAKRIVLNLMEERIKKISENRELYDYKSTLQELVQQQRLTLPDYSVIKEVGPDHQKLFFIQAKIQQGEVVVTSIGEGKTKKEAEQKAAKEILKKINFIE